MKPLRSSPFQSNRRETGLHCHFKLKWCQPPKWNSSRHCKDAHACTRRQTFTQNDIFLGGKRMKVFNQPKNDKWFFFSFFLCGHYMNEAKIVIFPLIADLFWWMFWWSVASCIHSPHKYASINLFKVTNNNCSADTLNRYCGKTGN